MNETTDASAVFAPLWRRKWLILAVAILVAAGSYLYYSRQPSVYSATTQVYLGNGAEEQSQIGAGSGAVKKAVAPNPTTQAALINSSVIKETTRARLHREPQNHVVHAALKGHIRAKSTEKSEFITIEGEAHNARGVVLLVNATAQVYVQRQNAHYRRQVEAAIALTRRQIRRIEAGQAVAQIQAAGATGATGAAGATKGKAPAKSSSDATATIQSATLSAKINQLESDLGVSQVTQVNPAKVKDALLVSPHPKSNALFGFAIGLLLAAFAAYALSRFDRRLRALAAVEEVFQAQVLTALQAVKRPLIDRNGQPAPAYVLREALWRLQTTLRVGATGVTNAAENGGAHTSHTGPRTILCVSADSGDGKSTLIAALALAWAEAGERVAVLEADFRHPVLGRLLGVGGAQGLADVLAGTLTLEQVLQTVRFKRPDAVSVHTPASSPPVPASASMVSTDTPSTVVPIPAPTPAGSAATVVTNTGSVSVLVGGTGVANPPALLSRPETNELVRSLAEDYDHVLIDAPSPLQVSDVMPLLAIVDGIVIVARMGHTRVASAHHLVGLLQRTPSAPVLGVAVNAVSRADIRKYGIYVDAGQYRRGLRQSLIGR